MEVRKYAASPALGFLVACPNNCGEPDRMEITGSSGYKKYDCQCTGCGEKMSQNYVVPMFSFEFVIS